MENNNDIKHTIAVNALRNVLDPEIGLSVIDLGLIYELNFNEKESQLHCIMTLTTQACPMGDSIRSRVHDCLSDVFRHYTVDVELTFEPPWSPEMISEEGKNILNS
jgi:metal-sulfur cluster biosynthetic enzyme